MTLFFIFSNHVSTAQNNTTAQEIKQKIEQNLSAASGIINSDPKKALEILEETQTLSKSINDFESLVKTYLSSGRIKAISGDFENSLKDFEEALKISKDNSFKDLQGKAVNSIGNYYYFTGDMAKALEYYNEAVPLAKEAKDTTGLLHYLNNLGVIYGNLGDYEKSINFYLEALGYSEQVGNKSGVMNAHLNIGTIYYEMNIYDKAEQSYNKALQLGIETDNKLLESNCYINLGQISSRQNKFDEAIEYFQKAIDIKRSTDEKPGLAIALSNIGSNYKYKKDYSNALKYLSEALSISKEINNTEGFITAALDLGNVYSELGNSSKALSLYEEALTNAESVNLTIAVDLYKSAAAEYYKIGNVRKAYDYIEKREALHDSLFNERVAVKVNELQIKYDLEKKEREVELLKNEQTINELRLDKEILVRNAFVIGFIVLLVVAAILIWSIRNKNKNNALLQEQNAQIENQAQELDELNRNKDRLFSILAHDLRNPLASILGYSEILTYEASSLSEDEIHQFSKNIYEVSNRLSNLLTNLLGWANFQMKKVETNCVDVNLLHEVKHIQELYSGNLKAKELNIEIDVNDDISLRTDKNMLHSIVQNLLSNAIKYSNDNSKIVIKAVKDEGIVRLSVQDFGMGIDDERKGNLFIGKYMKSMDGTKKEKGSGLGLVLVKEMVDMLKGTITLESELAKGTTITVSLPVDPECENV